MQSAACPCSCLSTLFVFLFRENYAGVNFKPLALMFRCIDSYYWLFLWKRKNGSRNNAFPEKIQLKRSNFRLAERCIRVEREFLPLLENILMTTFQQQLHVFWESLERNCILLSLPSSLIDDRDWKCIHLCDKRRHILFKQVFITPFVKHVKLPSRTSNTQSWRFHHESQVSVSLFLRNG